MKKNPVAAALVLGVFLFAGMAAFATIAAKAALEVKAHERTVEVKGLAEREVPADLVIWPLVYQLAGNDLAELFEAITGNNEIITRFLADQRLDLGDVTVSAPTIVDRHAQAYGNASGAQYRYVGTASVTLYTDDVEAARRAMSNSIELGKRGIALSGDQYGNRVQFLFTRLNAIKPAMIEEATVNARAVAAKFAEDSDSSLGKIRTARQGQFSISDRDSTTPHVKKLRVVSTVEYYLSD